MSPSATPTSRAAKGRQKNSTGKPAPKKATASKHAVPAKAVKEPKKTERVAVTKTVKEVAPKKVTKTKEVKVVQAKIEKTKSPEKEKKGKRSSAPEPEVKKTIKAASAKEKKVLKEEKKSLHEEKKPPVEIPPQAEEKKKERKIKAKAKVEPPEEIIEVAPPLLEDDLEDTPKKRGRKKKIVEDADFADFDDDKPARGKRAGGGMRHIVDEFLEPEPLMEEDDLISPDELDPLDLPLELLDPELVDVPRPATSHPVPKPKTPKGERRMQKCVSCEGMFSWLSVDGQCFSCLKKAIAKRKRDDESYSDFSADSEAEDDDV